MLIVSSALSMFDMIKFIPESLCDLAVAPSTTSRNSGDENPFNALHSVSLDILLIVLVN
jgi:hypothetical protein